MKVVLVDDEYPALIRIKDLIAASPYTLNILGEASTGHKAIQLIEATQPDAIFLDIQLPDMTGFEILSKLKTNPFVIFTTAYQDFALKAFEFYAIDYLVKPIQQERFNLAIQKLSSLKTKTAIDSFAILDQWIKQQKQPKPHAFPIKEKDRILLVEFEDIVYLKAEDKYVNIVLKDGKKHLLTTTLNQLELELPDEFIRVHRSYIVNKNYVYEIQRYFKGRFILKLNDQQRNSITTSEKYASKLKEVFRI